MQTFKVTIKGDSGLHARPASMLAMEAQKYSSDIVFENKGKKVNAKSIMSILSAGASNGDELSFKIDGEDEVEAMNKIIELFDVL